MWGSWHRLHGPLPHICTIMQSPPAHLCLPALTVARVLARVPADMLSDRHSRPGTLLYEAKSQGSGCLAGPMKRTRPMLEDLCEAASGIGNPLLCAAVPHDPSVMLKANFKRPRRMTLAVAQELEIRKMLEMAQGCSVFCTETTTSSLHLTMNRDQLNRKRDIGLSMLVMASNAFNTSTHTFVLASSIFDRFLAKTVMVEPSLIKAPLATQYSLNCNTSMQAIEMPLACFIMACKFCETYAPRLTDVVGAVKNCCTVQQLREAEIQILACLNWDIPSITGKISPATFPLSLCSAYTYVSSRYTCTIST